MGRVKNNPSGRLWSAVEETQRREIERALEKSGGHTKQAAEELGIDRTTLYKIAARIGLDLKAFRAQVKESDDPDWLDSAAGSWLDDVAKEEG